MRYRITNPEPGLYCAEVRRGGRWISIRDGSGWELKPGEQASAPLADAAAAIHAHATIHAPHASFIPDLNELDLSGLKAFALGFAVAYLATGLYLGNALARHIPAMNVVGVAYYAVMWPGFVASASWGTPAPIVPKWAFSFRGRR